MRLEKKNHFLEEKEVEGQPFPLQVIASCRGGTQLCCGYVSVDEFVMANRLACICCCGKIAGSSAGVVQRKQEKRS